MVERGKGEGVGVGWWVVVVVALVDEVAEEDGEGAVRVRRMPSVVSRVRR